MPSVRLKMTKINKLKKAPTTPSFCPRDVTRAQDRPARKPEAHRGVCAIRLRLLPSPNVRQIHRGEMRVVSELRVRKGGGRRKRKSTVSL